MKRSEQSKQVVLLGGGPLLFRFAAELQKKNTPVQVVTSDRHSKERLSVEGAAGTFSDSLSRIGVPFRIVEDINSDRDLVEKPVDPQALFISIGAPWIFRQEFIARFGGRLLNVHGTRLPQNRGGGGFSWQVLRDNRLGYALIHRVEPGIDAGDILKVREFFYPPSCRVPADYEAVYQAETLALLLVLVEETAAGGPLKGIPQQEYFSIYWPRLATDIHGFIDWHWSLADIEKFICAFDDPYSGASTFLNETKVRLKGCFADYNDGGFHPFQKGIVFRKNAQGVFVATEHGTLVVTSVRDEAGNPANDSVKIGDRFYTPVEHLEKAMKFRAHYTPAGIKQ